MSGHEQQNIIVTSGPGERNFNYLGPVLKQDPSFGSLLAAFVYSHGLQGLDLSNGQHVSHNHASNNCHDSNTYYLTNPKERYQCINIIDQLQRSTISMTTSAKHIFIAQLHFFQSLYFSLVLLSQNKCTGQPVAALKISLHTKFKHQLVTFHSIFRFSVCGDH